jgi:hypothetical protein
VHPLGSGEHFEHALRRLGIPLAAGDHPLALRGPATHARAAFETFVACAREPALTAPDDDEHLGRHEGADLLMFDPGVGDLDFDPGTATGRHRFLLSFTRQFDMVDAGGDHLWLERLYFEIAVVLDVSFANDLQTIYGFAGQELDHPPADPFWNDTYTNVDGWAQAVETSPVFQAAFAAGPDSFEFDQGPI